MPTRTYTTKYEFKAAAALADIAKVEARLKALDAQTDKLGANVSGLKGLSAELASLAAAMTAVATASGKASAETGKVGRGGAARVSALTKQVQTLTAQLAALQAAGTGASAATAGIGAGAGAGGPGGKVAPGRSGGLASLARVAMGTAAVRRAAGVLGDAGKEQAEFLTGAAGRTAEVREQLKEYAGLRGENAGPTNRIVKEVTDFAMSTGASVDEAAEFLTSYEGSAPTGRGKGNVGGARKVDPKTGKEDRTLSQEALELGIARVGGQFATAVGLDPATAGDLTGVVGQYTKIDKLDDFTRQLAGLHYGLDTGRGRISSLARSELGAAGESITSGRTKDLAELGAWVGVTSSISKTGASAGTSYKQVSRLLNELPGSKSGDWLKSIGVTEADGDTAKLNVLADYMRDNKVAKIGDLLNEKGFGNSTDRAAVVGMIGNRDVLNQRIAAARSVPASQVYDRIGENQKSQMIATRKGDVAKDIALIEQGSGQEPLEAARSMAEAKLIEQNRLKATGFMGPIGDVVGKALSFGSATGEQQRVDEEVVNQLVERGKKAGVTDVYQKFQGQMGTGLGVRDDKAFAETFVREQSRVQAAEDAAGKIMQGAQLIGQGAQQLRQGGNGGGGPMGNVGAGVVPDRR